MGEVRGGFLLAAGRGTRLAPVTDVLPKPAVPLVGLPLVGYSLMHLHRAGFAHNAINAHHLVDRLKTSVEVVQAQHLFRMDLGWSIEKQLLGTGGGVRAAQEAGLLGNGDVLVMNCDVLCDVDVRRVIHDHQSSGADATLVVVPRPDATQFGALVVDEHGTLVDLAGLWSDEAALDRASWSGVFSGFSILGAEVFARLRAAPEVSCLVRDGLVPLLTGGGNVQVFRHTGRWQDLGTPQRFLEGQAMVLEGDWPLPTRNDDDWGQVHFGQAQWAIDGQGRTFGRATGVEGEGLEATPPFFIAPGVQIGKNVRIGPNVVVGPGARLGDKSRISNSLLMAGVQLDEASSIDGTVVGRFAGGNIWSRVT